MDAETREARWRRLATLLEPIHAQSVATARRLCRSASEGDDLHQEAVLRAFDKLHTLREESRFRSWFYATLLSRHRSRVRGGFWRRLVPLDDAFRSRPEPVGEDGSQWEEQAMRSERASRALGTLAAAEREAIVLFELDGYSIEEIAAMQGVSISAVKSRLARGRERLRRFYERCGWTEERGRTSSATSIRAAAEPGAGGPRDLACAALPATGTVGLPPRRETHE